MTVTAGMELRLLVTTLPAMPLQAAQCFGAALFDVPTK